MTVLEVIQKSTDFLAKKGVDSPRLQIELLLAQVLKMPRMKLYLNFDRRVADAELEQLRQIVIRRGNREPLQHILGTTSFCGIELTVNPQVLIPRPETELLAEHAWTFLSTLNLQPSTALDFGTGSGCLAIAIALKCASTEVHALDLSADALAVAKENAARYGLTERIQFHPGDGFTAPPRGLQFDLIVSNPPYIPSAEIDTLDPEVRDHDPKLALDGGPDGLDFYRRFAEEAPAFLKPHGRIMLEFGDGQAGSIRQIFENQKWQVEAIEMDLTRRPRFLRAKITS